jgi:hypothetical protein
MCTVVLPPGVNSIAIGATFLCWLHSKKIDLSTITAVQYSVIVWFSEYSKYTVELVCSSTGMEYNFVKYNARTNTNFEVQYDYDSVMHYGPYAFSKNGLKTVDPKVSKLLYLFLVSNCGFSGRICGSLLNPKE